MRNVVSVSGPTIVRYSMAFKQQIVSEIETGEITIGQARKKYGIAGGGTIQQWVKRLGKNHLLAKVVRVEKPNERDEKKKMEKRIRELESALADAHIKNVLYESLIEVADEHFKTDIKKNFGTKPSEKHVTDLSGPLNVSD